MKAGARWRLAVRGCLLLAFLSPGLRPSASTQREGTSFDALRTEIQSISASVHGTVGVSVRDLNSGQGFSILGNAPFVQASSIKIAILAALLKADQQGRLHLGDSVSWQKSQLVGGSGILQYFDSGSERLTLRDIAVLMMVLSDNSATNLVLDRLGVDSVNAWLEANGFSATRLNRRMMDQAAMNAGRENLSTPDDMCRLLEALYRGRLLDGVHTRLALEILSYPKETPLGRGLPANVVHADKPGSLPGVRTDSGIVVLAKRPFILCVMINHAAEEAAAERAIEAVSRATFQYFQSL